MTKNEERIAIVKDAIAQIKAHRFIARTGSVIHNSGEIGMYSIDEDDELQPIFKKAKKCVVCARGALFISAVRKFNNCTLKTRQNGVNKFLINWFTDKQIHIIEAKFENWDTSYYNYIESKYSNEINSNKRLLLIFNDLLKELKQQKS